MTGNRTVEQNRGTTAPAWDSGEPAPEAHNAEQDDEAEQAQSVADEALRTSAAGPGPTESAHGRGSSELMDDSTQDVVDHMRDMESSGLIDERAYEGEPNHDDNVDKYGDRAKLDDLPGDGS
jgi:hypothetical protein